MKIRKKDTVLIISGKDRGRKGKVLEALPFREKILVEGINIRKKHVKPKKQGEKGQIMEIATPISISNVKLICPKCGKAVRTKYKVEGKKKSRVCKKCEQEI